MGAKIFRTISQRHLMEPIEQASHEGTFDVEIMMKPGETMQRVVGFGASLTDSSAYLLNETLDDESRKQAMTDLFDPDQGIGLSMLRNPMGASDYARDVYSYDDMPDGKRDDSMEHFSIARDERNVIPLIHEAKRLNPDLKVVMSPWSAPAWMKTNGSMKAGSLREDCRETYARYFVQCLRAYGSHGIEVHAVTPQNEPLYEPTHYPSMAMSAQEETVFVRDHLRTAMREAGFKTLILGYDHNWDRCDYPLALLDGAAESFDGMAWHWYAGDPQSQSVVSELHPGKLSYVTEASGGEWIPGFEPAFSHLVGMIIQALNPGANAFVLWNIALDEHRGPTVPGFGESTCRGLLRVDSERRKASKEIDYYGLAHFSRHIRPGAHVVPTIATGNTDGARCVAALNEDGSRAMVLLNDGESPITVRAGWEDNAANVTLTPKAVATIVWR